MASVKEETARGIKWGLIQKCTMQPVQFLYGIILARLISPAEMGILGLTAIFFVIVGQLQQCGFGAALIRKQERTDEDICTVFWFNVAMSLILFTLLFLAAPWFAVVFNQPALINLTRVSALLMFLNSTVSVHMTLYQARRARAQDRGASVYIQNIGGILFAIGVTWFAGSFTWNTPSKLLIWLGGSGLFVVYMFHLLPIRIMSRLELNHGNPYIVWLTAIGFTCILATAAYVIYSRMSRTLFSRQ